MNKLVVTWRDLAPFGIGVLDPCAFGLRFQCDLSAEGRDLVAEFLGVSDDAFAPAQRLLVAENEAVASVWLPRDCLDQLAIFAFFRSGAVAVARASYGLVGVYDEDQAQRWAAWLSQGTRRSPGKDLLMRPPALVQHASISHVAPALAH